jgi:regulator of protease activity HflC (stomatin/prohibitin superfamily)
MDWEERVLPSIGNEVVKSVVAQYNAEQLLTQREKVRHQHWTKHSSSSSSATRVHDCRRMERLQYVLL